MTAVIITPQSQLSLHRDLNYTYSMHYWLCPVRLIHLIRLKSLFFEKKIEYLVFKIIVQVYQQLFPFLSGDAIFLRVQAEESNLKISANVTVRRNVFVRPTRPVLVIHLVRSIPKNIKPHVFDHWIKNTFSYQSRNKNAFQ